MLADGVRFAPHYEPVSNSDHLPMTLSAMSGLGATVDTLLDFRASYSRRLHEWVPGRSVQHWQDGSGKPDAYPALMNYFRSRINEEGHEAILGEVLGVFLPGIAMDAFHPVIRLGYAVDFGSPDEIAAALAYMTIVHRDVPVSATPLDLAVMVDSQSEQGKVEFRSSRFGDCIVELLTNEIYPTGTASNLKELATVSLDVYQATRNFFALHLVTATQALRCCVPGGLQQLGIQSMTGALLASHLVLGSPRVQMRPLPAPTQLDPEHAYKYTWACLSEYRCYGDDRYLSEIEAFKQAGLVPSWVPTQ